jgi:hypothetical protein
VLALLLVPVFFVAIRRVFKGRPPRGSVPAAHGAPPTAPQPASGAAGEG